MAWRKTALEQTRAARWPSIALASGSCQLSTVSTHGSAEGVAKGAYVLAEAGTRHRRRSSSIATGSEVALALKARETLEAEGTPTRVVSMPCWEWFNDAGGQLQAGPSCRRGIRARVSVEAGVEDGLA